jgi:non-heme chloroperoxidase
LLVHPAAVTRLQYAEQGDPSGIPVVMLHGYSDSWRSFEPLLPHLPPWIHAFALSQRGHGESERPGTGYDPSDLASDVAAFLDAQGIGRAMVIGHSMGSHVGQRFALEFPSRTMGIALLGSFFRFADNPGVIELMAAVRALTDPVDRGFALEFQKSTLAREIPPEYLEAVVQESLKLPATVWRAVAEELLTSEHWVRLGRIAAPTLILWGDRDLFCPRSDQDAFAATIPGARLLVYEGGGHAFHWEDPRRSAADVTAFIESVPRGRGPDRGPTRT